MNKMQTNLEGLKISQFEWQVLRALNNVLDGENEIIEEMDGLLNE